MITESIKVLITALAISCAVLIGTNVAIQRYSCGQRWGDIAPFQVQRCEPVSFIEDEIKEYMRLANAERNN